MTISIIIPTLNAAHSLQELVDRLRRQTQTSREIIVVDSESEDGTARLAETLGCRTLRIKRREFDHGGTRNYAAGQAQGDTLVFLTQDAMPVSETFLEQLTRPIDGVLTAGAYARQLPRPGASPAEVFARSYNYPALSSLRRLDTLPRRTLRALFFSNVASAVDRHCFERVGRFPAPIATNEDVLLCARLLDAGYQVAYAAEAQVLHSHDLASRALFARYFRIGAFASAQRETLRCESSSRDGLAFLWQQLAFLRRQGHLYAIPGAIAQSGIKALAYKLGQVFGPRLYS